MKVPGVCFGFDVEKLGGGWPDQQCCQPLQNAKEPTIIFLLITSVLSTNDFGHKLQKQAFKSIKITLPS